MGWLDDAINAGKKVAKVVTKGADTVAISAKKAAEQAAAAAAAATKKANQELKKAATAAEVVQLWAEIQALQAANTTQETAKVTAQKVLKAAQTGINDVNDVAQAALYDVSTWVKNNSGVVPFSITKASYGMNIGDLQKSQVNLTVEAVLKNKSITPFDISIDFNDLDSFSANLLVKIKDEIANKITLDSPPLDQMKTAIDNATTSLSNDITGTKVQVDKSFESANAVLINYNKPIIAIGTNKKLYTRANLDSSWIKAPDKGGLVTGITIMRDGTILGIGTDQNLYTRANLNSSWIYAPDKQGYKVTGITSVPI